MSRTLFKNDLYYYTQLKQKQKDKQKQKEKDKQDEQFKKLNPKGKKPHSPNHKRELSNKDRQISQKPENQANKSNGAHSGMLAYENMFKLGREGQRDRTEMDDLDEILQSIRRPGKNQSAEPQGQVRVKQKQERNVQGNAQGNVQGNVQVNVQGNNSNSKGKTQQTYKLKDKLIPIFKPKSTLTYKQPEKKTQANLELDEWKLRNKFKKTLQNEVDQKTNKKEEETQKNKQINQQFQQQNQEEKEQSQGPQIKDKQAKKIQSAPAKQKKIKKQTNFVRLDLKRKYADKFRGTLATSIRKLSYKNRMKDKAKIAARSQFANDNGELYNTYINSLSQALYFSVNLQDQEHEGTDPEQEQIQKSQKLQIPEKPSKQVLQSLLKNTFDFPSFRQGQYEVIRNLLQQKSTLFVSETASGKSLTYIMSSIILEGLSIVISPLISLMLDQLAHLPKDLPAACISSLLSYEQRNRILSLVKKGQIRLLFMTPQSLQTDFSYHLRQFPPVNFVCVDEAHCISELSHNFRTSYLVLQEMVLKYFKYKNEKPVVLCLTATANVQTIASIEAKLNIEETVRNSSVLNKNLFITVTRENVSHQKYEAVVNYLRLPQIRKCRGVLIYCRTRKILMQMFHYLVNSGTSLSIFHSALSHRQKVQTINNFRLGKLRIIASTNALGMGLDFEHLDCIIHLNIPKSIENYVQEVGRAGRRNRRAYCHLFLDPNDYFTERNYILADQLQNYHLRRIIEEVRKRSFKRIKQQTINQPHQKVQLKRDLQSMKDDEIFESEEIDGQDFNLQELQRMARQAIADNNCLNSNPFNPLSCIQVSTLTEMTSLRQEALLTILLKLQAAYNSKLLKVHPLSYQTLKVSFFKSNQVEIQTKSPFFKTLTRDCKLIKGSCYILLINKCNQLKMTPIQLLGDLYKLSSQVYLKIQLLNEVFLWEWVGQVGFEDLDTIEEASETKDKHQNTHKKKVAVKSVFNRVLEQINSQQRVALFKLNTYYTLAFMNSSVRMQSLLDRKQILKPHEQLPPQNIVSQFDQYFGSELQPFYNKLTTVQSQSNNPKSEANEEDPPVVLFQKTSYLPISQITAEDNLYLLGDIRTFMKNHTIYSKNSNPFSGQLTRGDLQQTVSKYTDGRLITRVFLGVNDSQVNWKMYGEHSYWMKYKTRNHQELLKAVKKAIKEYVIQENIFVI